MNAATAARLLALNRDFYERLGPSFSATRRRLQPGVKRILDGLQGDESILDLGCGNGELARALAQRGHRGPYLGLDFSLALLREAAALPDRAARSRRADRRSRVEAPSKRFSPRFLQTDITSNDWSPITDHWSLITAFAVLHHIPGEELRVKLLKKVHGLLAEDGRFVLSNWQFLNSPRLRSRLQPWRAVGLSDADVDPGDHLLDWRAGGGGLRYVHHFSAGELTGLAGQAGLRVSDSFLSDGEGGKLSLYQIFKKT